MQKIFSIFIRLSKRYSIYRKKSKIKKNFDLHLRKSFIFNIYTIYFIFFWNHRFIFKLRNIRLSNTYFHMYFRFEKNWTKNIEIRILWVFFYFYFLFIYLFSLLISILIRFRYYEMLVIEGFRNLINGFQNSIFFDSKKRIKIRFSLYYSILDLNTNDSKISV